MSITIKLSNGDKKTVEVPDLNVTVAQFKELTESVIGIPADEQRIVLRGKVLKDSDVLSVMGLEHGQAVHIVRGQKPKSQATPSCASVPTASNPSSATSYSNPSASNVTPDPTSASSNPYMALMGNTTGRPDGGWTQTGGGGSFLPTSAEGVLPLSQSPLFSQIMQDMARNPQLMQAMMQYVGSAQGDNNSAVQQMLSNPALMQYIMQLAANPESIQEIMRVTGGGNSLSASQGSLFGQQLPGVTGSLPPQADLRTLYQSQLQQLREMGFPNEEANLAALRQSQGNLDFAIERLLNG